MGLSNLLVQCISQGRHRGTNGNSRENLQSIMLRPSAGETLRAWLLSALVVHGAVAGNPDAKRLYDDLLSNYNKLVRPVVNTSDVLRVCIKLKLSQLIDVLSSKTALSHTYIENPARMSKGEQDMSSLWSYCSAAKCKTNKNEIEPESKFSNYATSFDQKYPGNTLNKNFSSEKSRMPVEKSSRHKSSRILNSKDEDSRIHSNSSIVCASKAKRRISKRNLVEGFLKKFKNVETMSEMEEMLENFRIINVDEGEREKEHYGNIVPGYFVLKKTNKSANNLKNLDESHSSTAESLKLIFAKKKVSKHKRHHGHHKEYNTVKRKDKIVQTLDGEKYTPYTSQDTYTHSKEFLKLTEPKICPACVKMEEDYKYQRQFNATLLEQVKNMMGQLTSMVGLLNDLLNCKNDHNINKEEELMLKEKILKNFLNLKDHVDENMRICNGGAQVILRRMAPGKTSLKSLRTGESLSECISSEDSLKMYNDLKKDVSLLIPPEKHEEIFYVSRLETDKAKEKADAERYSWCRCTPQKRYMKIILPIWEILSYF